MTTLQQLDRRCPFVVTLERAACRRFEAELCVLVDLTPVAGSARVVKGGIDDDGRPYLDQVIDADLRPLDGDAPRDPAAAVAFACSLLAALAGLHAQGTVHRAVRPDAVLTGPGGTVVLVDPVPAVVAERMGPPVPALAAPEVLEGERATAASDVFAAAATLVRLVTGRSPWPDGGMDAGDVLLRMLGSPPELGLLAVTPAWASAVRAALAVDPAARPGAAELAARLAGDGRTRPADPAGPRVHAGDGRDAVPASFGGATLGVRFELGEELGRGATGTVYRARWLDGGGDRDGPGPTGPVAVKVLHPSRADDLVAVARFVAEKGALTSIDHPGVVRVHGVLSDLDRLAIVMDLVDGPTLRHWLRLRPALPPTVAYRMVAQMADALAAVHRAGVVHRDFKPANVLLEGAGTPHVRPLLTDFGIARSPVLGDDITETGQRLGSPGYMAPEVMDGSPAGPAADVYALGVVAFELLSGWHPFTEAATSTVPRPGAGSELVPERPPGLPTVLWEPVRAALALDPAHRPPAEALGRAFAAQSRRAGDILEIARFERAPRLYSVPARSPSPVPVAPVAHRAPPVGGDAPTTDVGTPLPTRPPDPGGPGWWRRHRAVVAAAAGLSLVAGVGAGAWAARSGDDPGGDRDPGSGPVEVVLVLLPTFGEMQDDRFRLTFTPAAGADDHVVFEDYDNEGNGRRLDVQPLAGAGYVDVTPTADGERHCYVVAALVPEDRLDDPEAARRSAIQDACVP